MKESTVLPPQSNYYIPTIAIQSATLRHSINRMGVATTRRPDQVCGEARRVGYAGKEEHDLALYRLKIRPGPGRPTMTLPGFYIIVDGLFRDYEQWKQEQE